VLETRLGGKKGEPFDRQGAASSLRARFDQHRSLGGDPSNQKAEYELRQRQRLTQFLSSAIAARELIAPHFWWRRFFRQWHISPLARAAPYQRLAFSIICFENNWLPGGSISCDFTKKLVLGGGRVIP